MNYLRKTSRQERKLTARRLTLEYLNGTTLETQGFGNDGHPLSDILTIYREDGLTPSQAIPIKGKEGERAKVVAHTGQSSSMGVYIIQGYS
jgi:hypothetical protein